MSVLHSTLTDADLHTLGYIQAVDPGAVGANKSWVDTSLGTGKYDLKIRNSTDTDWESVTNGSGDARYLKLDGSNSPITGNLQIGDSATDYHGINTSPVQYQMLTATFSQNNVSQYFIRGTQSATGINGLGAFDAIGYKHTLTMTGEFNDAVTYNDTALDFSNVFNGSIGGSVNLNLIAGNFSVAFNGNIASSPTSIILSGGVFSVTGNLGTAGTTIKYAGNFAAAGTADTNYAVYADAASATNNYSFYGVRGDLYNNGNIIIGSGYDIKPDSNSTTAINIAQSDGTNFITFDTTNKRMGINGTPTVGFDCTDYMRSVQTVDQITTPGFDVQQLASTTMDGSASTGTSEDFDAKYEAVKFTTTGAISVRSIGIRLKKTGTLEPSSGLIYFDIFTDDAGVPGSIVSTGATYIYFSALTTSFAEYKNYAAVDLSALTSYWIVLRKSTSITGGTIEIDSTNTGTALHAYSAAIGGPWTTENNKTLYFKLYGRTYYGTYSISSNNIGVYGISTTNYGVRGTSTTGAGVYGTSTHGIGVTGSSTYGAGCYFSTTSGYGVWGYASTTGVGVYAQATSGSALQAISTTGRSAYIYRNNSAGTVPVCTIEEDNATGTQTVLVIDGDSTGDLLNVIDGTTEVFTILDGGNVGLTTATPTARLHLPAGTATASTAPLKFTSGTSLTTAEAGAMEFTTDDLYFTITTGAARKGIVLNDGTNLTSGRVPFATTNGRLTDDADLTFTGSYLRVGTNALATSIDPQIMVGRNVDDSTAGNAHAFADSSYITRAGTIGYNSFDAMPTFGGTENYDHYAGFQFAPTYSSSGTVGNIYGFYNTLSISAGTCTNFFGNYVANPAGAGTVTNCYGSYIAKLDKGATLNYAFYARDNISVFRVDTGGNGAEVLPVTLWNGYITDGSAVGLDFMTSTSHVGKIVCKRNGNSDYSLLFSTFGATGLFQALEIDKSGNLITFGNATIGVGTAGVDYTLTFNGESNDGVITWKEDEDYFDMACGFNCGTAAHNMIYVSKDGNDNYPGFTPSAAKLTVAAAVAIAASGDTVYVFPGTYAEADITLPAGVDLVGANRENTIISAASSNSSAIILTSSNGTSNISNITIYETTADPDGGSSYRHGIRIGHNDGTNTVLNIENCKIIGCWDGIYLEPGSTGHTITIRNSIISSPWDGIGFWCDTTTLNVYDTQISIQGMAAGATGGEGCIRMGSSAVAGACSNQTLYMKNCRLTATTDNNNASLFGVQVQAGTGTGHTVTIIDTEINVDGTLKTNAYGVAVQDDCICKLQNVCATVTGATNNYGYASSGGGRIIPESGNYFSPDMHPAQRQNYELGGQFLDILTAPKLLLTMATPITTEIDLSGAVHNGTYTGFEDEDQIQKGNVWALDLDGSTEYIVVADHADFSFGNGTTDEPFSACGWAEFPGTAAIYNLLTKYNSNASAREWVIGTNVTTGYFYLQIWDQSAGVACIRNSDAIVAAGWHFWAVTYDGVEGATAANGIKLYIDGLLIASTATNNASYVAMENLAANVEVGALIGSGGTHVSLWPRDLGVVAITAEELTATQIWKLYVKTKGYYGM